MAMVHIPILIFKLPRTADHLALALGMKFVFFGRVATKATG